jgi:hypothetical protein
VEGQPPGPRVRKLLQLLQVSWLKKPFFSFAIDAEAFKARLLVQGTLKAGLHYGDYRSKLVPFEEQKNILYILKRL